MPNETKNQYVKVTQYDGGIVAVELTPAVLNPIGDLIDLLDEAHNAEIDRETTWTEHERETPPCQTCAALRAGRVLLREVRGKKL